MPCRWPGRPRSSGSAGAVSIINRSLSQRLIWPSCGGWMNCIWSIPFAGSRMLRDLLAGRGLHGRASACRHADEAHGHRGALSQAQHLQAGARPPDLSLSAAQAADHPTEPGLGHGHHVHPHGARLCLSGGGRSTGSAGAVLAWRLSITLEAAFCIEALEEALARYGRPEIFNTDSQMDQRQFPGGLTLTPIDRLVGWRRKASRCGLTHTPIDQPCLSLDLSAARERLAVRLCLADACDPRRA